MKKILFLVLSVLCLFSCVKKKALKHDPDLVGTWVAADVKDSTYYWLIVTPDGNANYRSYEGKNDDTRYSGELKYSVFELKMWVGDVKFKVKEWLTADMKGVSELWAKDHETLANTKYELDRRMVLKTTILRSSRLITFYRIKQ